VLEREDGPVVMEDFEDDDPHAANPIPLATAGPHRRLVVLSTRLPTGWRRRSCNCRPLNAFGLRNTAARRSGSVADWLRGEAPPSLREGFSAPLMLRFAVDDVKAYCLEAAAAGATNPNG
jgi:hypothetical protein